MEDIQLKVDNITRILGDFGFNSIYFGGIDADSDYTSPYESFLLSGEHVSGIKFRKGFYNYKEFLGIPVKYIVSDILHITLKAKLGE